MGTRRAGLAGAAALIASIMALGPVPFGTGGSTPPKKGTYAGGGNMTGDANRWVQVGFTFKQGTIAEEAFVYSYPNCSGGASVPDAPVGQDGRFKAVQVLGGTPPGKNVIRGRFVEPTRIKGKVKLEREDPAACGDPGVYKYEFKARRFGGP